MQNFSYYKTENNFRIYTNDNYIPLGFAYDYYMTQEQCERFGESYRDDMMLKALLLDEEQIEKYQNVLTCVDTSEAFNNIYREDGEQDYSLEGYYFSPETVQTDCAHLRQNASYNFKRNNRGFTCTIDLDKKNLVFFSVPYEDGWTAYVNGKPAEIEKVNVGFMAVMADAGVNEIEFVYTTPGLMGGVYITVAAFVLFALYLAAAYFYDKKKPYRPEYPEGEALRALWDSYDKADAEAQELEELQEDLYFGTDTETAEPEGEEFSLKYRTHLGGFQIDDSFLTDPEPEPEKDPPEEQEDE